MESARTRRRWHRTALFAVALGAGVGLVVPAVLWGVPVPSASAAAQSGPVHVVAAENFWGNIAAQIGGRAVQVTSLVTNPNADPHLFETNAQGAALLAQAQVVIENGAGYDTWMGSLLSADGGHPRMVNAASVLDITGSDPNPHLWYDIPRVPKVAAAIATALGEADPAGRTAFARNLSRFNATLVPLESQLAKIRSQYHHVPVAYTERVPGYLLADAELGVKTPSGFARSVEDGTDPGPADTVAMRTLITNHDIKVLLYNVQAVTPVTTQMRALAEQHGIPVVGVSETMPPGMATYQKWQGSQLTHLVEALQKSRNSN